MLDPKPGAAPTASEFRPCLNPCALAPSASQPLPTSATTQLEGAAREVERDLKRGRAPNLWWVRPNLGSARPVLGRSGPEHQGGVDHIWGSAMLVGRTDLAMGKADVHSGPPLAVVKCRRSGDVSVGGSPRSAPILVQRSPHARAFGTGGIGGKGVDVNEIPLLLLRHWHSARLDQIRRGLVVSKW